jgi:hypothetical protein
MCGRPVTDVRRSSGMFVSTASPARCGTMMEAANVALRPGSSKQGKAERAPVASNCVTMMGGVCGEGARVGQSIVLSGGGSQLIVLSGSHLRGGRADVHPAGVLPCVLDDQGADRTGCEVDR